MRAKEAKTISIVEYLNRQGFSPAKQRLGGKEYWYSSPLRAGDSDPSFKVDTELNIRYDHGLSKGGTIIDLVCDLHHVSVREALQLLESTGLGFSTWKVSIQPIVQKNIALAVEKEKKPGFQITKIGPIRHPALLQYLDSRSIDHDIAGRYLKEIHFKSPNKLAEYFALGWPSGDGFEARSSLFKGFVGQTKDISRIGLADGKSLSIFEGFMDFLSYLSFYRIRDFKNAAIILNSTALKKRVLEEIENYVRILAIMNGDSGDREHLFSPYVRIVVAFYYIRAGGHYGWKSITTRT